ncbi:MAG: hypothetical protein HN921_13730 [Bacteroidetes bacterium]|jgi:hypothetical protein|nr:hypothetical protein [Bacteroidota bacterium]MBT5990425.1 hypothetical protein [Bacteroidota bacterium]MBT7040892.1 hypothetical protein [Bacteroidota bacterium]MBT7827417.1 hypothetical protein [Bacteroidota bacterium]
MENQHSIFGKILIQGFIILIITTITMLVVRIQIEKSMVWQIGNLGLYSFVLINPFLAIKSENLSSYITYSAIVFVALIIDLFIICLLLSATHLSELHSLFPFSILPLVCYPFAMILGGIIRKTRKTKSSIE